MRGWGRVSVRCRRTGSSTQHCRPWSPPQTPKLHSSHSPPFFQSPESCLPMAAAAAAAPERACRRVAAAAAPAALEGGAGGLSPLPRRAGLGGRLVSEPRRGPQAAQLLRVVSLVSCRRLRVTGERLAVL